MAEFVNEGERLTALAVVPAIDDDHRKLGHRNRETAHLPKIDAPMRPAHQENENVVFLKPPSPKIESPTLPGGALLTFIIDFEKFADRPADLPACQFGGW
jgi:hypothetical protein